jgi:type I restriction enzyme M protein
LVVLVPEGRRRCFEYAELAMHDKLDLDPFWIKDMALEDAENLPNPDVPAQEIAEDLKTALEPFRTIANDLKE